MKKLYNVETKEKYLEIYDNEQTKKTIRNVFQNTELIENVLDKDLYDLNLSELGTAIENTNPYNKNVAKSNGRFISQYISWAIENGYRKSNLNPLRGVENDWYNNFIDKTKKIHLSFDEFFELLENKNMMNNQDKAFLFLMFEGILGEQFNEIKELTLSDVDWENKEIFVKGRKKKIKVSEDCIRYLEKAYREKTYYQYNSKTKELNEKELLPSQYILKNIKSPRGKENQPIRLNVFYARIHALKEVLDLEYLTPNGIRQSGMIKMTVDIFKKVGILGYEQLAIVGEKYNFSTLTNNGYEYYNTYLMKDFINEGNIKKLYHIDVTINKR